MQFVFLDQEAFTNGLEVPDHTVAESVELSDFPQEAEDYNQAGESGNCCKTTPLAVADSDYKSSEPDKESLGPLEVSEAISPVSDAETAVPKAVKDLDSINDNAMVDASPIGTPLVLETSFSLDQNDTTATQTGALYAPVDKDDSEKLKAIDVGDNVVATTSTKKACNIDPIAEPQGSLSENSEALDSTNINITPAATTAVESKVSVNGAFNIDSTTNEDVFENTETPDLLKECTALTAQTVIPTIDSNKAIESLIEEKSTPQQRVTGNIDVPSSPLSDTLTKEAGQRFPEREEHVTIESPDEDVLISSPVTSTADSFAHGDFSASTSKLYTTCKTVNSSNEVEPLPLIHVKEFDLCADNIYQDDEQSPGNIPDSGKPLLSKKTDNTSINSSTSFDSNLNTFG